MVRAIAAEGHEIAVSQRGAANAARLQAAYENVMVADNQAVIDRSDLVIVGLMAEAAADVLAPLAFRPDQQLVSVMAGVSRDRLSAMIGRACPVTIAIPFPAIAQGGSPLLVYPRSALVEKLFSGKNHILTMPDEASLAAFMAAQAVLSPLVRMLEETSEWLVSRGVAKVSADAFLRTLAASSLTARAPEEAAPFKAILEELNTPGGLNATLREHMLERGMAEDLRAGLDALERRLSGA